MVLAAVMHVLLVPDQFHQSSYFRIGKDLRGFGERTFRQSGRVFHIVVAVVVSQFTSQISAQLGIVSEAFASWLQVDFLASSIFWCSVIYLLILVGRYSESVSNAF